MSVRPNTFFIEKFARKATRFRRCERGATAIEFVLVAPILIVILLATLQVSVIFFAQSILGYATEEGMRLVLTNQANNLTQTQFKQDICRNVLALFNCNNIIVSLQAAPADAAAIPAALPQFDKNGNLVSTSVQYSIPAPTNGVEPIMILVVMYQWPVISGPLGFNFGNLANGSLLLASTEVFQIEPQI